MSELISIRFDAMNQTASSVSDMSDLTILGLITARGGSKTLPRKNVLELAGKPLIAWTISAALSSSSLSRTIVTTDDSEIADVSQKYGAEVPFVRPRELAGDTSSHIGVVLHALDWLACVERYEPDYVLLLQPTVPFRTAADIDAAVALARRHDADSVVSVAPSPAHPYLMKTIDEDGYLQDFVHAIQGDLPRQTLSDIFALNGALYLIRPTVLRNRMAWYADRTVAYVMPAERSIDIDTAWDFAIAEFIITNLMQDESVAHRGGVLSHQLEI